MSPHSLRPYNTKIRVCLNPIFIIASPRSGTTGFARALARHSELWASEETLILYALFKEDRLESEFERWFNRPNASWLRMQNVDRNEFLSYVGLGLNALFTDRSHGRRWVDHTPHYALMVDTLAAMFPGAYFLHLLRDGRSAVDSMINIGNTYDAKLEEEMRAGRFLPRWASDFKTACETWRQSVEASMKACERYPDRCLTVSYERLARAPKTEFRKVFKFIDAPFEDKPVNTWQSKRVNSSFSTLDADRVRLDGTERWLRWTPDQRRIFEEVAGPAILTYGLCGAQDLGGDTPHSRRGNATYGTS
jgi:Sulfotransferase family